MSPAVRSSTQAQRIACGLEDVPQAISPPFGPGGNSLTFAYPDATIPDFSWLADTGAQFPHIAPPATMTVPENEL
jgi:hypothetical protein